MRKLAASLVFVFSALLAGCSNGTSNVLNPSGPAVRGAQGLVHGGTQPITDATIQLWAVGTTGYGSTATPLLATTVTTSDGTMLSNSNANAGNANNTLIAGNFTITGDYTCPASDPQVYITASGGNPGLTAGTNNSAILLMAALTDCNTLKANAATTFINMDEVTTVASAYALAQFINPATGSVGAYSYASTGLQNAFGTVGNMVSISGGSALSTTPNGNGVVPQTEINSLANILAPCIDSSSNTSPQCSTLFGYLQSSSGHAPTNSLLAALSMALHPAYNVALLFGAAGGSPPFQPALTSAPNDWTIALSFNDGGSTLNQFAIDGYGNLWVTNGNSGGTTTTLSKLNWLGVPQSGSPFTANLNGATPLAIDDQNNVYVGNQGTNALAGFSNSGNSFGPFTGLHSPTAMAFDASSELWIANNGNSSVAEFNTNTDSFISSGYTAGGITTPNGIAMDIYGNAWVSNASTVTELNLIGIPSLGSPYSSGGITTPKKIVLDGSNNVWISNFPTGSVSELSNTGVALTSGSGDTAGGASSSNTIAVDGAGDIWVADRNQNQLAELDSSGAGITAGTGYRGGGMNAPKAITIDQSGNVWVGNLNPTTTGTVTTNISEFIGLGAPTVQPVVSALEQYQIGQKPGATIPIMILSQAIPPYVPNVSYSAQLYATGGNSNSYTWSIASGALPNPLGITGGGLISGTTATTGSTTVTVQACDSQNLSNCSTQALAVSANSSLTPAGNESAITGSYALQFEGYKNNSLGAAQVAGSDYIASITFNGAGAVTGEIDTNNKTASSTISTTLAGYYTFGSDHRGILDIIPAASAKPLEFAFSGSNFNGSTPQTLRLIEFDDTVPGTGGNNYSTGAGVAKLQTSSAFSAATFNQGFVFGLQGETPCSYIPSVNLNCLQNVSPYGPLSAVGMFTGTGSNTIPSGEEDVAAVNNTYNLIGLSGTYTSPDSAGRGTLTLTPTGTLYPAPPSNYVYYIVNSGEMFVMSSDGHLTASMLSGDVLAQSNALSGGSLSGSLVGWEESPTGGDGVSVFPGSLDSSVIYLAAQSGNQLAVTIDENPGGQGTLKVEQSQGTFTYSIDSKGRMTIGSGGTGQPVFYVASAGQLFGTEQPSATSQGGPGLITVQQQTTGSFGCSAITGTFAVGNPPMPIQNQATSGISNLSTGAITLDASNPNGQIFFGRPATVTCSQDSLTATTGRLTETFTETTGPFISTGIEVVYPIVPNSKYVLMDLSPSDNQSPIYILEK